MRQFLEFVNSFEDIKTLVLNVLDPDKALDRKNKDILDQKLSEFKNSKILLHEPELQDIINESPSRGAILLAMKDPETTIGSLITLINRKTKVTPKEDYLG